MRSYDTRPDVLLAVDGDDGCVFVAMLVSPCVVGRDVAELARRCPTVAMPLRLSEGAAYV